MSEPYRLRRRRDLGLVKVFGGSEGGDLLFPSRWMGMGDSARAVVQSSVGLRAEDLCTYGQVRICICTGYMTVLRLKVGLLQSLCYFLR